MRYPANKTSITTLDIVSVVFLRQARRLERERGAGLKNTHPALLCQVHCHPHRARRKWRKVVTGDPNKRIRDHMREVPQVRVFFFDVFELPCDTDFIQVKLYDKISFTFGVLCICGTEVERRRRI